MRSTVIALTDPAGDYRYPAEVKFEIRQNVQADYARAAEFVNFSDIQLVAIQHEHGIFGGDDGEYVLDFVRALRVRSVVTLHTVLEKPTENQRSVVRALAARCARVVVMSRIARDLLAKAYGLGGDEIVVVPHGIPVMDLHCDRQALKRRFGVAGRPLLLTFGLLGPNKGIETVIRALPRVVAALPDLVYFVVGATHPSVRRREGEAYRTMIEREAETLGVREHLVLRDQYVEDNELRHYLQAADVFISPYLNEAQVTSGALSYAMGAGAAVVSTPYWHARELLAKGRGRLFPSGDHAALSGALLELFASPDELELARSSARDFARTMAWPRIGDVYYGLLRDALRTPSPHGPQAMPAREPAAASRLPELRLDHLLRMTDDTGIVQHATYSVPARRSGYCVDDNARALMVAVHADRVHGSSQTRSLVTTYLSYLYASQEESGLFRNFMSYERVLELATPSDDCVGRAIWALGVTAELAEDDGCKRLAREMLLRALPHARALGPRGNAQTILGLAYVAVCDSGAVEARRMLETLAAKLVETYRANAAGDWQWFESALTYDNAILPLSLIAAFRVTGDRSLLRHALDSLEFLEQVCFAGDHMQLVGNTGWHRAGGERADADEQAIDAAALVLAFRAAYDVTRDRHYLKRMRQAFGWFLGANRLGAPLYDFTTGGCRDGIGVAEVNQNQGAESTICFLMALLHTLEADDIGGAGARAPATA